MLQAIAIIAAVIVGSVALVLCLVIYAMSRYPQYEHDDIDWTPPGPDWPSARPNGRHLTLVKTDRGNQ